MVKAPQHHALGPWTRVDSLHCTMHLGWGSFFGHLAHSGVHGRRLLTRQVGKKRRPPHQMTDSKVRSQLLGKRPGSAPLCEVYLPFLLAYPRQPRQKPAFALTLALEVALLREVLLPGPPLARPAGTPTTAYAEQGEPIANQQQPVVTNGHGPSCPRRTLEPVPTTTAVQGAEERTTNNNRCCWLAMGSPCSA